MAQAVEKQVEQPAGLVALVATLTGQDPVDPGPVSAEGRRLERWNHDLAGAPATR